MKRDNLNHTSNEELARILHRKDPKPAPIRPEASSNSAQLPSVQQPIGGPQQWQLGPRETEMGPASERERRALFAALSKGTKANLGRDPTVTELVLLVEEVNRARAVVSSAQDAINGSLSVYIDAGVLIFRGSTSEQLRTAAPGRDGRRQTGAM